MSYANRFLPEPRTEDGTAVHTCRLVVGEIPGAETKYRTTCTCAWWSPWTVKSAQAMEDSFVHLREANQLRLFT